MLCKSSRSNDRKGCKNDRHGHSGYILKEVVEGRLSNRDNFIEFNRRGGKLLEFHVSLLAKEQEYIDVYLEGIFQPLELWILDFNLYKDIQKIKDYNELLASL